MFKFIAGWVVGLTLAVAAGSLVFIIGNSFNSGEWVYWEFMRNWLIGYLLIEFIAMLVKVARRLG